MIKGLGTDIIDVARVKKTITDGTRFSEKVFTPSEIAYCEDKHRKEEHYAARFAAKEAFFKALGTGWRFGMRWQDIEIGNDELGKPEIRLSGLTLDNFKKTGASVVHVTLSHTRDYAVAFVVIE